MTTLVPTEYISVKTLGAKGDGTTDDTVAIQLAMSTGGNIYFPKGTYKVTSVLNIVSNTTLFADKNATILSTIASIPSNYNNIIESTGTVTNVAMYGLKFLTTQLGFRALGLLYEVTNLTLEDNECDGCALVCTFAGGDSILVTNNYIHNPANGNAFNDYCRAIQITRTITDPNISNVIISNNNIQGNFTHGIEVMGKVVDYTVTTDKPLYNVTVTGNVVVAGAMAYSAGGIWFSNGANISVTGNHVENWGDVGIDFEECLNAVANGNTLKNNSRNLTLFGINANILFSNNSCYNNVNNMAHFVNANANTVAVTTANTDIVLDGNTFITDVSTFTGEEKIDVGTAGRFVFNNNKCVNTWLTAVYFNLTQIVISNNNFYASYASSLTANAPIEVGQIYKNASGEVGPFRCSILNNFIEIVNDAAGYSCINYTLKDVAGGTPEFSYYVNIQNNVAVSNSNIAGAASIYIKDLANSGPTTALSVNCTGNDVSRPIFFTPKTLGSRVENINISNNYDQSGQLYYENLISASALQVWALSYITTAAAPITWTLANGQFVGQQKIIQMAAYGSATGTVTIANYSSGVNVNATFTATNQIAVLTWDGAKWNKVIATCAGL